MLRLAFIKRTHIVSKAALLSQTIAPYSAALGKTLDRFHTVPFPQRPPSVAVILL
jgi:hypothetical protein